VPDTNDQNAARRQWLTTSRSSEAGMDIEDRVKLDATAAKEKRERQKQTRMMRDWNARVPTADDSTRWSPAR